MFGGKLAIESAPGKGTRIEAWLPRNGGDELMIRILIVDDHAILRAGLKHILAESTDIVVAGEASNGNEALAKIRAENWDVVVLDMTMPGKAASN